MADQAIESRAEDSPHATSGEDLYANLALPPDHIRLLDLNAAPESECDAPLTGVLRVERLRNLPTFDTLSYLWATETSQGATIRCFPSGTDLSITTNCARALQCIRGQFGSVTIWVDAICIDQDNEKEKETQIPLMGAIYSQAQTGYIWLEGDGDEFDRAAHEIRVRSIVHKRLPLAYLAASSEAQKRCELARLKQRRLNDVLARRGNGTYKDTVNRNSWHARLEVLFNHAWLGRIWTFQELVLSRNPLILIGDRVILWEDLVNAVLITPQSVTGQERWGNLIRLWLDFPRQHYVEQMQPVDVVTTISDEYPATSSDYSFRKLIDSSPLDHVDAPWHYIMFRCGTEGVKLWLWAFILWYRLWIVVLISAAIMVPFGVFQQKSLRDSFVSNPGWFALLIIAVVSMSAGTITLLCAIYSKKSKTMSIRQILHGVDRQGPYEWTPSSSSLNTVILDAIWTTLRTRKSSNDHDMVYGLAAVLKACGIMTSSPDYSQSIKITYKTMFQGILSWEPRAVQMIVDARVETEPVSDWPSWLPDWRSPKPNTWLFGHSKAKHKWLQKFPRSSRPPIISDEGLLVSGKRFGKILKCFRFTSVSLEDQNSLTAALVLLIGFMGAVFDLPAVETDAHRRGSIFAVFKGLLFREQNTTKVDVGGLPGDPPATNVYQLPEVEAPYNFTEHRKDFEGFTRLGDLIHKPWQRKHRLGQRDSVEDVEELLNEVRQDGDAVGYLIRSVNQLADEKRCIFVLSSGKVGSGSYLAAAGDEVLIIPGVSTPLAVRQKAGKGSYQLLGPALVHGVFVEEIRHDGQFDDIVLE